MTASQTAVVIGGTSGIGLALARGFDEAGWDVTAAGLNAPDCAGLARDRLRLAELDITDPDAVDALICDVERIDALINAAGIIRRDEEFELETFEEVLKVNLTGMMRTCTGAHARLAASHGCIINVASMLSSFGGGNVPAYAASKGGVVQLTKSLAIAWAKDGIRVNAIAPGWITTPLTADLAADVDRSQAILRRTPMGRWGQPEELVGPALFLASPAASFVTGAVLNVDGGYSIC